MDKPTKEEVVEKADVVLESIKTSKLPVWAKYTITALIGAGVALVCTFCLSSCTISSDTANKIKAVVPYLITVEK